MIKQSHPADESYSVPALLRAIEETRKEILTTEVDEARSVPLAVIQVILTRAAELTRAMPATDAPQRALIEQWRQQIGGKTRYDIGISRALLMCAEQLETILVSRHD